VRSGRDRTAEFARWGAAETAGAFLIRHRETFLRLIGERRALLEPRFNDIQTLDYAPSFDHCVELAHAFLSSIPTNPLS
jgi:hypothetical protein